MRGSFRAIRGDGSHHVALRFAPESAGRVAEKQWHASQTLEPQPDGSLIVRFQVTDLREIKRWVLSWGAECEVLEPRELCELIVRDLCQILQRQGVSTHDRERLYVSGRFIRPGRFLTQKVTGGALKRWP